MLCPKCDEKLACQDSRQQPTGVVNRNYRCRKCGARVRTVEVMVRFKEAKGKEQAPATITGRRAKARAELAAQILESQGVEI